MEITKIGDKIAEARKKKNFSQAQLGEQLFISAQAVGKWERGEAMPDIMTFNRLGEILGVDLNYFSDNFPSATGEVVVLTAEKPEPKLNWNMSRGNWVDADLTGLKDLHEKFSSSNMLRCKFSGSALPGLLLRSNSIDSCDFEGSDLAGSRIQNSHIVNNSFNGCGFQAAEFSGSHIQGCDFTDTDFTGTVFKASSFRKNTMLNAVLNRTAFYISDIDGLVFEGKLENCSFENCSFSGVNFQNATLINTFFKNRKLKGIKFIDCQADRMTYEFLKNGKADMSGLSLLTS
jgi:uncharacterized protein YjbI with pentapeptide repeats